MAVAKRRHRGVALYAVTAAITAGFSYVALRGIDLHKAWSALRESDWWWMVPALAAFGLGNLARALRWRSLFSPARRPPRSTTLNAMMIGYLYNNILPARAGEAARVLVLTRRSATPPVEIASTVVLERVYDTVSILLIFFLAEPWLPRVSWFGPAALMALVLALALVLAAAVLAVYQERPVRALLRPLTRLRPAFGERLEHVAAEVAHGLAGLRERRVALEALAWTMIAWSMSILCAYLVIRGLRLHVPFAAGVLVMVAIALSMILPSAPAAVGVFEGAALIALQAYRVGHSAGLTYALVLHLVNFVPFVLAGVVLLSYNARRPAEATVAALAAPARVAQRSATWASRKGSAATRS